MDNLKIVSLNVRGWRNKTKRNKMMQLFRRQTPDFVFVQETHGCKQTNHMWESEWGMQCLFANGESNARGVAILLGKKFGKSTPETIIRSPEGRYIIVQIKTELLNIALVNVYAPNVDDPRFFQNLHNEINQLQSENVIYGGDFNLVLNDKWDRGNSIEQNIKAQGEIKKYVRAESLVDAWREMNPQKKCFTWARSKPKWVWSRIDNILISKHLLNKIENCNIVPSICTDHSMLILEVRISECKRGPGLWKLNVKLLESESFCEEMCSSMEQILQKFQYLDIFERWELLKFEVVRLCKERGKTCKRKKNEDIFNLYKLKEWLQSDLIQCPGNEDAINTLISVDSKLNLWAEEEAKASAFRCKVQWYEGGEKMSKYFFSLEKRNYVRKNMQCTQGCDGKLIWDPIQIVNAQRDFYKKLYTADSNVQFGITNTTGIKLDTTRASRFDQCITESEIFDAIMTLKKGKTPGCDGLPIEFYVKFWKVLRTPLMELYDKVVETGKLNTSARKGVINLIPKKSLELTLVKNWRPITLLNYDYKIYAKILANRMEEATDLIGNQQTGFIRGRSIHNNIRRTQEVLVHLRKNNLPGIIAEIDFSKCFDRIDYLAIKGTFQYFGFTDKFIKMLFALFSEFEFCNANNGHLSDFQLKGRGVNQGCPASPLCYIFAGEVMAHLIQGNNDIKGAPISQLCDILSQFADDSGAFLKWEQNTVTEFCRALTRVETNLGLQVSYDKTTMYRVGSIWKSNAKMYTEQNLKWSSKPIETLGVTLCCDGSLDQGNYDKVLSKIDKVCANWIHRRLSLQGKILIINTLMASIFVYKMFVLTKMPDNMLKTVVDKFKQFLWNDKRAKIAYDTLTKLRADGGMQLVDVNAKRKSLQIAVIFKSEDDNFLRECMYNSLEPVLGSVIWRCNINVKDVRERFDTNNFWGQALEAWAEINFRYPDCENTVKDEIIWLNSHIRINNKPILWAKWIKTGILFVDDLLDNTNNRLLWYKFKDKFSLDEADWLKFNMLQSAIPKEWFKICQNAPGGTPGVKLYHQCAAKKKIASFVYRKLISDKSIIPKYHQRWLNIGIPLDYEAYETCFKKWYYMSKKVKLRGFQYRLLLNKITTNKDLFEWDMHVYFVYFL